MVGAANLEIRAFENSIFGWPGRGRATMRMERSVRADVGGICEIPETALGISEPFQEAVQNSKSEES